ncbi:MAG: hypothetical protein U1E76_25745 [Planctomycetota bacterium]
MTGGGARDVRAHLREPAPAEHERARAGDRNGEQLAQRSERAVGSCAPRPAGVAPRRDLAAGRALAGVQQRNTSRYARGSSSSAASTAPRTSARTSVSSGSSTVATSGTPETACRRRRRFWT